MIICHVSDNHGLLERLDSTAEVIVHSGDFLPSFSRGIRAIEPHRQISWIHDNGDRLKEWIADRPFIITPGNHDYVPNIADELRAWDIEAWDLHAEGPLTHNGVRFVGFPYVPRFTGEWNYELEMPDMQRAVDDLDLTGCDVLVAHSPFFGVLDRNHRGERCGNMHMRKKLQDLETKPRLYLTGHIHEANDWQVWSGGMRVSNAATGQRRIIL